MHGDMNAAGALKVTRAVARRALGVAGLTGARRGVCVEAVEEEASVCGFKEKLTKIP